MANSCKLGQATLLFFLALTVLSAIGCGTETYDERVKQRGDALRYAETEDHYDK